MAKKNRMVFHKSIGGKLIITFLTIGILAVGTITIIAVFLEKSSLIELAKEELELSLEAEGKGLLADINGWNEEISSIATNKSLELDAWLYLNNRNYKHPCGHTGYDHIQDFFNKTIETKEMFSSIGLIDMNGTVVIANERSKVLVGDNRADREYFIKGQKGYFVEQPKLSANAAELLGLEGEVATMVISHPIKYKGSVIAVLMMRVDFHHLSEHLNEIGELVGESGEIYLVNEDGYMVTNSRFTDTISEELKSKYGITNDTTLKLQMINPKTNELTYGVNKLVTEKAYGENIIGYHDYRGVPVVGVWKWLNGEGFDIGLMIEKDVQEINKPITSLVLILVGIALVICIIILISALILSRTITKPIETFRDIFATAASGDLTIRYPLPKINCSDMLKCGHNECKDYGNDDALCFLTSGSSAPNFGLDIHCPSILSGKYEDCCECKIFKKAWGDEISNMGAFFNKFIANLHDTISTTDDISENLFKSSQELSDGANSVAEGAQSQASSTEEISASIEEFTSSIVQVADNVNNVDEKFISLLETSKKSKAVVSEVMKGMDRIAESSENINEIVNVISDIADQTNLLSLNASIEAARAGEQGRGFSVVAEAISQLADRSASSTKEIVSLIKNSTKAVQNGNNLINEVDTAFNQIESGIKGNADLITQIKTAIDQQKQGSEQIRSAIEEITEVTQSASANTEEMASSSNNLRNQAEQLSMMVKKFKLHKDNNSEKGVTIKD